jgi:hypothetical protein
MAKIFTKATLIALPFIVPACALFDSGTDTVVDDYNVTWIDVHEQRALLYKSSKLVPYYVFAVGNNSRFVFAKQHPLLAKSEKKVDETVVYYYIIERTINQSQDKPVYGPLSEESFRLKCSELGIKEPSFTLRYPTNL